MFCKSYDVQGVTRVIWWRHMRKFMRKNLNIWLSDIIDCRRELIIISKESYWYAVSIKIKKNWYVMSFVAPLWLQFRNFLENLFFYHCDVILCQNFPDTCHAYRFDQVQNFLSISSKKKKKKKKKKKNIKKKI